MSRTVRRQIFQKFEELWQENQKITTYRTEEAGLQEVLAGCQNMAVDLGTQIEKVYGEGLDCVHGLENYCEIIYRIAVEQDAQNKRELESSAKEILQDIKKCMEQEIPDKLEVVFLPYKVSMWDSLESIWLAAREDGTCDAYVIPIPYYDKNADGSFGEEHYEGGEYPAYVPVTGYDSYDFEARQPDIVFIHNPYDQCNHVTSVHPFFYTKNIKKVTEKLVYIPYFILNDGRELETPEAVEEVKKFCLTPGVLQAEKVVVQSEKMRRLYIKILTEISGGGETIKKYWENRISGIGSPKVDKIFGTCEESIEIPSEWKKILEEAGEKRKKVIFYNTSVDAFLKSSDAMLQKMEQVFQVFQNRCADVILWWRPHPLLESTIDSMRPDLLEYYKKIQRKYREAGWGIYDDMPDMNAAIACSDGYYGDMSSVAYLYAKEEKPVLIQNPYQNWRVFSGCTLSGQEMYFCMAGHEVLLKYDLNQGTTSVVAKIEMEEKKLDSIVMMQSDAEYIYMLEMNGERLVRYSLTTWQYDTIRLSCNQDRYNNFAAMGKYEHDIFIFPRCADYIVKIEDGQKAVRVGEKLYKELNEMQYNAPFFSYGVQKGNDMWLVREKGQILVRYQMDSDQYTIYDCPQLTGACIQIFAYEDRIYILSTAGKVYEWDMEEKKIEELLDLKAREGQYARLVVLKDKIIILPQSGEDIWLFDLTDKSLSKYDSYPADFKYQIPGDGTKYSNYCENDEGYYFAQQSANYILCINKQTESIEWKKLSFDENAVERYMAQDDIDHEGIIKLEEYLDWIIKKDEKHSDKKQQVNIGKNIWEEMRG
ncbi:MAG: hypothetical protein MRZ93_05540 [Lachnospiraceae bacterium]|nr:hypothetical protein [Lachnospiraceae bacterium]